MPDINTEKIENTGKIKNMSIEKSETKNDAFILMQKISSLLDEEDIDIIDKYIAIKNLEIMMYNHFIYNIRVNLEKEE